MSKSAQDDVALAVPAVGRSLPSGRHVVVRVDEQGETRRDPLARRRGRDRDRAESAVFGAKQTRNPKTVGSGISIPPSGTETVNIADLNMVSANNSQTYMITASADTGGSSTPAGSVMVTRGEEKEFTITPADGYRIADVKVDDISVGPVESFSFNDITTDHTISAVFSTD